MKTPLSPIERLLKAAVKLRFKVSCAQQDVAPYYPEVEEMMLAILRETGCDALLTYERGQMICQEAWTELKKGDLLSAK